MFEAYFAKYFGTTKHIFLKIYVECFCAERIRFKVKKGKRFNFSKALLKYDAMPYFLKPQALKNANPEVDYK